MNSKNKIQEAKQYWQELEIVTDLVKGYFNGDIKKICQWLDTENPSLGNLTPRAMLRLGRHDKLISFIQGALGENFP